MLYEINKFIIISIYRIPSYKIIYDLCYAEFNCIKMLIILFNCLYSFWDLGTISKILN